jgi:hypothetical protein
MYPLDYKIDDESAFLSAEPTVDPETIIWENLGVPNLINKTRIGKNACFSIMVGIISLSGITAIALFEKHNYNWDKNDCQGNSIYEIDHAINDYHLDWPH